MASMSGQSIGGQYGYNVPGFTLQQVDASNDGVAFITRAQTTNAITHLWFRYGARSLTPPTYRISLQGVDATTGEPDGTVLGGGSPASATFTPPADASWDGLGQSVALTNSYTPAIDEQFAIVIEYSTGTIDASNRSSFTVSSSAFTGTINSEEYGLTLTAGSWSKATTSPVFGVITASERYGAFVESSYTTGVSTQTHRIAVKFRIPTDATNTFTVNAWDCIGRNGSAGKTPKTGIWNAAGTELQALTWDSDITRIASNARYSIYRFATSSPASLSAGTWYYIGLEAVDAVPGTLEINGISVGDAANRQCWPGGADMMLASWDGAAWTDIDTVFPLATIRLATMTQQAGGGGGGGGYVIGG